MEHEVLMDMHEAQSHLNSGVSGGFRTVPMMIKKDIIFTRCKVNNETSIVNNYVCTKNLENQKRFKNDHLDICSILRNDHIANYEIINIHSDNDVISGIFRLA